MEGPPVVAGYRLVELIGTGATGAVYRAERPGDDARVALKLLSPELAATNGPGGGFCASRDRRRAWTIRTSCRSSTSARPTASVYLAMRLVEGADLRELLARDGAADPGPRRWAARAQVAAALDEAHARASSIATSSPRTSSSTRDGDGLPRRLRPRQARLVGEQPDRRARLRRDDRLRRAGADQGRADRRPRRRLLAGLRALRVPRGRAAVRARERAGRRLRAPARARAAASATCGPICPSGLDHVIAHRRRPRSRRTATRPAPS